ncbi:MAG: hypothetical protein MJ109_06745 [Kiritimatiellae bacterium]|nr:hypothetical protein [Kiritimatiellia bacterium]
MHNLLASLLIVVSVSTYQNPEWRAVVDALQAKHSDMKVEVLTAAPSVLDAGVILKEKAPRYVAYVMTPEEARYNTIIKLHYAMRSLDDDPYDDAIWGIVSGPTAKDALRIASSNEPTELYSTLSTTGLGMDITSGPVTMFSDGYPEGCWKTQRDGVVTEHQKEGDITDEFVKAWNETDPDLILTSSHASQFNLEMPFSRGNIVSVNGMFYACPDLKLIDYTTGQFKPEATSTFNLQPSPLASPTREKVWIAAGNCLIADNKGSSNMVMTALGFGKVNQFVGYIKTTWFGEIGWGTWGNFASSHYPLNESYYFANQNLVRTLVELEPTVQGKHLNEYPKEVLGKLWDYDGTCFWGDPVQKVGLKGAKKPVGIIFPESKKGRKLVSAPEGFEVFVADDFALVTKSPKNYPADWESKLIFE